MSDRSDVYLVIGGDIKECVLQDLLEALQGFQIDDDGDSAGSDDLEQMFRKASRDGMPSKKLYLAEVAGGYPEDLLLFLEKNNIDFSIQQDGCYGAYDADIETYVGDRHQWHLLSSEGQRFIPADIVYNLAISNRRLSELRPALRELSEELSPGPIRIITDPVTDLRKLMTRAYEVATKSNDPSTQNGAILVNDKGLVVAEGWNRFPAGHRENRVRMDNREHKYGVIVHAEEAAIWDAIKKGQCTKGLTLVCPWAACSMCARSILEAGIKRVVTHAEAMAREHVSSKGRKQWDDTIRRARAMFIEAGVEYQEIDGELIAAPAVLYSGRLWKP